MNAPVDVLVAGAGPVGLVLALQAHALGANVRIVERRSQMFRPPRALIMHPRTLEMLRPLGVVEAILARASTAPRVNLLVGDDVVPVELDELGLPDTPYPHLTLVRQADVELVLAAALAERGVSVERGRELSGCTGHDGDPLVEAELRTAGRIDRIACRWVAGCDGADSTVRRLAGIARRETAYRQEILLADVDLTGALRPGVAHVCVDRRGLCFLFPQGESAPWRLLITRPATGRAGGAGHPGPAPDQAELQSLLDASRMPARITTTGWSTRLHLRFGVAPVYRNGPMFLVGDAAHVHSPAGGLGMNVGIHDAINLGWKFARASASTRPGFLLDSYGQERRRAALRALWQTNVIFRMEAGTGPVMSLARGFLAPLAAPLLPVLVHRRRLIAFAARRLGQLDVSYRESALSQAAPRRPGRLRPGDRLPDVVAEVDGRRIRLHETIARPGVHVLLDRDAPTVTPVSAGVHLHRLGSPGAGVMVVRPDGHLGACAAHADDPAVAAWLAEIGARLETDEGRMS